MNTIFNACYLASWALFSAGYVCRTLPRLTPKWRDDRTMEQLGAFFYGAAVVVLFV